MTQNTTYKRPNTVLTDTRAYQALADSWGVQVDDLYTDTHREAVADYKHWQELVSTVATPNVYDLVMTTDRDSWLKTLKRQATDAVAAQLISDADARTEAALRQRIDNTLTNAEAWHHVATVLDVDKAVADYTEAVQALGTTVRDAVRAAQRDPNAFATYMRISPQLLYLDALGPRYKDTAALHADVPDLPPLTYSKDGFSRITKHYDEDTLNLHRVAGKMHSDAREDDWLIGLALGEYPGFELNTTLDPDLYRARKAKLDAAGQTEQV
ncbi:hypothetical protein [Corynebacterium nuruki]|uniref:hypothetical protein n=1 Tax=Corynebacterium nuruki TaxID=1032851 RepID=UPI0039BFFD3F